MTLYKNELMQTNKLFSKKFFVIALILFSALLLAGCTQTNSDTNGPTFSGEINTFSFVNNNLCTENGKPVIRMFSTTWCSHCGWIKDTFDSTVKEYVDSGKIVAYHWELDTGNNTLTDVAETNVPESEQSIFTQFSPNGSVPVFVFGCQYYRIGNGYEKTSDLVSEEGEFRAVIEKLITEQK